MRVFVISGVDKIYEDRGLSTTQTSGETVRCFGRDDVCCWMEQERARLPATSEGGPKTTIFVAILEGLRVRSVIFRAISAGIGREIGGL
jgi:hypothetical protein